MAEGFVLVHIHIESEKANLEANAVLAGVVSHDRINFLRTRFAALFFGLSVNVKICFTGNPGRVELQ